MTKFFKNIAHIMTGVGGAQAISLLAAPLVARLFSPSDFGVASLFLAVAAIISIPGTFRLEHAIILPADDDESLLITRAATQVLSIFVLGLFVLTVLLFFTEPDFVALAGFGWLILLFPLQVFWVGLAKIGVGVATREKQFKTIGRGFLAQSGVIVSGRLTLGYLFGSSSVSLVSTLLLGAFFRVIVMSCSIKQSVLQWFEWLKLGEFKILLANYRQFPMYSVPTGLLREFNDNLPILALTVIFGPTAVGFYAMASRLIRLPIRVISEPVRMAYLQRLAQDIIHARPIVGELLLITAVLGIGGVGIVAPLVWFGQPIFSFVLGDKWVDAGLYAAILSPWFASVFIQSPASCIYVVLKKQDVLLVIQGVFTAALLLVCIYVQINRVGVEQALIVMTIIGVGINALTVIYAINLGVGYQKQLVQ